MASSKTALFVLTVAVALLGLSLLAIAPASTFSPFINSYPLPEGQDGAPASLLEANGRYWFAAPGINAIGALEITAPETYTYTFYPIPTDASSPYDLAWDGENIWFTELDGNKLGKLNVANETISEYEVPTADSQPTGVAWGPAGAVWFVQRDGNNLVAFNPLSEEFTEYPITNYSGKPLADAQPEDVATSTATNEVWFTAPGIKRLIVFDLTSNKFTDTPTAPLFDPPYTPSQVVLDDWGGAWVSTLEGQVGRFAPSTFSYFRWYQVAPEDSTIEGLNWTADGRNHQLWFTESNTGYAGRLLTDSGGGLLLDWRVPVAAPNSHLSGLVAGSDGAIWLADAHYHELLSWSPPSLPFSTHLPIMLNME